jgi:hypothetical protein
MKNILKLTSRLIELTMFGYVAGLIFLAWMAWLLLPWWGPIVMPGYTVALAGQWGDSFGVFNALMSAFGFIAILGTLLLQSLSLRDQRKQTHLDRFDTTFFQMLELLRDIRKEVSFIPSTTGRPVQGASALTAAAADAVVILRQFEPRPRNF